MDANPHIFTGFRPGDLNIASAVHPWARGTGVAVAAVELICEFIRKHRLGRRAAIQVEPENTASVQVAQKAGSFTAAISLPTPTQIRTMRLRP